MTLPLILGLVIASIAAGILTSKVIGYWTPNMIVCSIMMSIGAGLMTTFTTETGPAKWIGYQVVFGLGIGMGFQQPSVAAQTLLPKKDVPTGVSLMFFGQNVGGALFVSVGQNVLSNRLAKSLSQVAGVDPAAVVNAGATNLRAMVPPQTLDAVLKDYGNALTNVFYVAVAVSCLSLVGALCMEWESVKGRKER